MAFRESLIMRVIIYDLSTTKKYSGTPRRNARRPSQYAGRMGVPTLYSCYM